MIQGLRLLPFTADVPIFNCDTCRNGDKKMRLTPQSEAVRRRQACGYLPRDPSVREVFGLPAGVGFQPGLGDPDSPEFVPICPGYLTSLPEVQETVRIRPHWLKGAAAIFLRGSDVNTDLTAALDAQAVLDGAVTAKERHDAGERNRKAEEARRG